MGLYGGNDTVSLDSWANGGNKALGEKVTVYSGAGTETVRLAGGQNVKMSGAGHWLAVAPGAAPSLNGTALNLVEQRRRLAQVRRAEREWHQLE